MKKFLLALGLLMVSFFAKAQRFDYDTTITGISGAAWNAIIHLPPNYYNNTTDSFPCILWFTGLGEVGTDSSLAGLNGPASYMRHKGWNGAVTLPSGVTHYPIIITLQPNASFQFATLVKPKIDAIMSRFRIIRRQKSLSLTGPSMGGWQSNQFICYKATTSDSTYAQMIATVVNVEGVIPDDADGAALTFPNKFLTPARTGIKYWGFEQSGDNRNIPILISTWNSVAPGTAVYQQTAFGSTGHGYFNYFYGGTGTASDGSNQTPNKWVWNGKTLDVYQFMVMFSDTLDDYHTVIGASNIYAGDPIQTQLPSTTTTLTATFTPAVGTNLVSSLWSILVNPGHAVISLPGALSTGVTGLDKWGTYVFQIISKDGTGAFDTSTVRVDQASACNVLAPKSYIATPTTSGAFDLDARTQPWLGGDTVYIPDGSYTSIVIYDVSGDPCHPIHFKPLNNAVTNFLSLNTHSQYLDWDGRNKAGVPYSMRVRVGNSEACVKAELFNHIEMQWLEVDSSLDGSAGFFMKTTPDATRPETIYPNYEMNTLHIHDCIIKQSGNESMYIGSTSPYKQDAGQPPYFPIRLRNVRIDHNQIFNAGWDAIQLSGALDGNRIDHNFIYNFGIKNASSQQAGIILGSATTGQVDSNQVIKGTGNGGEIFGYATINWFGNVFDSCGRDGTLNGQEVILSNDQISNLESVSPQQVNITNNQIIRPQSKGAIGFYNESSSSAAGVIQNNTFCIPGASSGTWQGLYIHTSPAATITGNILNTSCGTSSKPTVSAGIDQTLILPTNFTTLLGSAIASGSATISTYSWVRTSGPNTPTITSPSSATTAISGLIQGVYTFTLTATDSNGNFNSASVNVTVTPLVANCNCLNYVIPTQVK